MQTFLPLVVERRARARRRTEDQGGVVPLRVRLQAAAGRASLLVLEAPGLGALAREVRYGGQQFDTHGRIAAPEIIPVSPSADGDYIIMLPGPGIGLLTVAGRH